MFKLTGAVFVTTTMLAIATAQAKSADPAAVDEIFNQATKVKAVANETVLYLRSKPADLSRIPEQVRNLNNDVRNLRASVGDFESRNRASLSGRDLQDFEAIRSLAALVNVFADHELSLLNSDDLERQRELLLAKTESIVKRTGLLLEAAAHLK